MKPDELRAIGAWLDEYIDIILCVITACAAASAIGGCLYDAGTDDRPFMVATMFAWPWLLPPAVFWLNASVLRLRTRDERKQIKTAKHKAKLAEMERELLDV